jgi:hypothetical protein
MNLLGNEHLQAQFDPKTGALTHLLHPATGWHVQRRTELAIAPQLFVPLPNRRAHYVGGSDQPAPTIQQTADTIQFHWTSFTSPHVGQLAIECCCRVSLSGEQLRFDTELINHSPYTIESTIWPALGDLTNPAPGEDLDRINLFYNSMQRVPLYPKFPNERGYWGVDHAVQLVSTPDSPFMLISGKRAGLYVAAHGVEADYLIQYQVKLKPGYSTWGATTVPADDEIAGTPVHYELSTIHFPFLPPGGRIQLQPIVLQPYIGDWQAGTDIYKTWRNTWFKPAITPAWAQDVHSWYQVQINAIEDELRCPYRELEKYGAVCARHGITAIQLVGWTQSGQDGRLPLHEVDARLGSREELKAAIARIRAMGVKVVLYEKFTFADISTDWYKAELHQYMSRDCFGNRHGHAGWMYHTPTHLAGINTRRLDSACMHHPGWRALAVREVAHSLELDPDGVLLDESLWHGNDARYCFAQDHGHPVPAYNFGGDALFERELCNMLEQQSPQMLLAGEGCHDLQFRHYALSYTRIYPDHTPVHRYIDPWAPIMAGVIGYDEREAINQCLLFRYIISYEPRNFKGDLEEFPLTLAYGKQVDALRRRYREYLWDAEFQGTRGAQVITANEQSHPTYAIFRHKTSGKPAIVIANQNTTEQISIKVKSPEISRWTSVTPENPKPQNCLDATLTVAPRSAVVLLPA